MLAKCRQISNLSHISKKQMTEIIHNNTGMEIGYCVVQRMQIAESLSHKNAEVMAKFLDIEVSTIRTIKDTKAKAGLGPVKATQVRDYFTSKGYPKTKEKWQEWSKANQTDKAGE
jgi:repressor of nif and glnA expression